MKKSALLTKYQGGGTPAAAESPAPAASPEKPAAPFVQSQDPDDFQSDAGGNVPTSTGNAYADALIAEADKAIRKRASRTAVIAELNSKLKPYGLQMK
jgi:hypothetical protein